MRESVSRIVPYDPADLFKLVGDVERYPQFVPWLTRLRTWNRRPGGEGVTLFDAEAEVGFSLIHERFSTRVTLDEPNLTIHIALIAGPFRRLTSRWSFAPAPGGTRSDFEIDFEFKSKLLDRVLAANFHRAVARLIACFDERARVLYGPKG